MADALPPFGFWESIATAGTALGAAGAALFRGRTHKADLAHMRTRIHDIIDREATANERIAKVETGVTNINDRLDRIEDKLDRLLERPR